MARQPRARYRIAVEVAKGGIVLVLAMMACGVGATVTTQHVTTERDSAATAPHTRTPAQRARVDRLMARHDCSTTGFGADVLPESALVLRDQRVRHVSFDAGWAVFTGTAPGTLIAVCRAAPSGHVAG